MFHSCAALSFAKYAFGAVTVIDAVSAPIRVTRHSLHFGMPLDIITPPSRSVEWFPVALRIQKRPMRPPLLSSQALPFESIA